MKVNTFQSKIQTFNDVKSQAISIKTQPTLTDKISFKGLKNKETKCFFVFDLDGSLVKGNNKEIQDILKLQKQRNALLIYATGRNLKKFQEKQGNLKKQNINLPNPDFLIARNGLYVYKNQDGIMTEDTNWSNSLIESFNKEKVSSIIEGIAFRPKYLMPNVQSSTNNYNDSKLCAFEFWPSPKMLQFICDTSVADEMPTTLEKELTSNGVHCQILKQSFSKEECDRLCSPEQLSIIEPRYSADNYITQIDIMPANKADAVKYLANQEKVPLDEVVMAGNDENDISMSNLTKKGAFFICVANATKFLKKHLAIIKNKNIIFPSNDGALGIKEGLDKIIRN